MTDLRVVYGARCSWWDTIDKVGKGLSGLPCCPHCGGMLFEVDSEERWFRTVDEYEAKGNPGYRKMMVWMRGKCFPTFAMAKVAYAEQSRDDA